MSDTKPLMTCPLCGAIDILEQRGMYATTFKCDNPGDTPREVKLKVYVAGSAGGCSMRWKLRLLDIL